MSKTQSKAPFLVLHSKLFLYWKMTLVIKELITYIIGITRNLIIVIERRSILQFEKPLYFRTNKIIGMF